MAYNIKSWVWLIGIATLFSMTACEKDGKNGVVSERNLLTDGNPPVAIADIEPVRAVCPSATPIKVTYDGRESFDTDGKIVSYEWFVNMDGSDTLLSTETTGEIPDLCAMVGNRSGKYEVGLTVEDNDGNRATDTKIIEIQRIKPVAKPVVPVEPSNAAPVAVAGDDRTVDEGASVILDAKGSYDSDGNIVKYEWKEGSAVLATTSAFEYGPVAVGNHLLTLTVTDNDGATAQDTVVVTGNEVNNEPNNAPTAVISEPNEDIYLMCYEGDVEAIRLNGEESSDPDGDTLTFVWSGTSNGVSFNYLIDNRDKKIASVPLGEAGEGKLCDFVEENCERADGGLGCKVTFNLNVGDGQANDTDEVTVIVNYPI